MKRFYRFRNLNNLIGEKYNELEKQTIYFASPKQLNDPMEGFKNLVFNGDSIVYKNLFKHYLMCLCWSKSFYLLNKKEKGVNNILDIIPVFNSPEDFITNEQKELFEKIYINFFKIFDSSINILAEKKILRLKELKLYLFLIHNIALSVIEENFSSLSTSKTKQSLENLEYLNEIKEIILLNSKLNNNEEVINKLNDLVNQEILNYYSKDKSILKLSNERFLIIDFIDVYLKNLEKLMYPNWYTACFMTESHNSSVWGHYGDSHKGVCLIFETNERESITFSNGKIGEDLNGVVKGNIEHKFYKVNYQEGYPEIDFFRSIGRLPEGRLYSTWYKGYSSDSKIFDDFKQDEDKWRKNYWDTFYKNILIKTKDWEYEKEYRLILSGLLDDEIKKENRTLQYDFKHLKGLIFGIKTPLEDKLKIIDIIANKCKINNRIDFEFYQAYYCHENKNIQHKKLNLIKFKN